MKSIGQVRTTRLVALLLAAGLALAACREDEQGRMISFEKGVYPGSNPSEPVADETLKDLRNRAKQTQGRY